MDINRLIQIVASQPQVTNPASRYSFLQHLLFSSREAYKIIGGIDLSGGSNVAAAAIVMGIMGGEDLPVDYSPSRYYILDAINQLIEMVPGHSNKEFLRQTAHEIANKVGGGVALTLPAASPDLSSDSWTGEEEGPNAEGLYNEKVIDENTLRPIYHLSLGLAAADSVCKISYPAQAGSVGRLAGTGFLVTPRHVLTNHHVISDHLLLPKTDLQFRYEQVSSGGEKEIVRAQARLDKEVITSKGLDVTLFELDDASVNLLQNAGIAPLTLSQIPVHVNHRVSIIQHPGGEYKQISFQNNKVQGVGATFIDYTTTTLPGSSGSPVFDDDFRVVAIHRAGGDLKKPGTNIYYYRNRGTMITAVIAFLTQNGITSLTTVEQ